MRLLRLVFLFKNQRKAQLNAGASMVHLRIDLHDHDHIDRIDLHDHDTRFSFFFYIRKSEGGLVGYLKDQHVFLRPTSVSLI